MRPRNTKRTRINDKRRGWDDWQRYVQRETQRLSKKSSRQVVELSFSEIEPPPPPPDEPVHHPEEVVPDVGEGRRPPVPGVPREEALRISNDEPGRTVQPFTVQDYRNIRPLAGSGPIEPATATVAQEPVSEPVVEAPVKKPPPEPVREETGKRPGRKKKKRAGELELFPDGMKEHQAVSRRRLTRSVKLEREELIEKLLDPVISLQEAAMLIGVCKTTVRRYTNRGELDCLRTPGRQRRFKLSQVLAFVKKREEEEKAGRAKRRKGK